MPAATANVTGSVAYALAGPAGTPTASSSPPTPRWFRKRQLSWQCVEVDAAGIVIPGFSQGVDGSVTVPFGTRVRCTAVNQTARLHLIKTVTNHNGGTASRRSGP